jgi:hypothetical protein
VRRVSFRSALSHCSSSTLVGGSVRGWFRQSRGHGLFLLELSLELYERALLHVRFQVHGRRRCIGGLFCAAVLAIGTEEGLVGTHQASERPPLKHCPASNVSHFALRQRSREL